LRLASLSRGASGGRYRPLQHVTGHSYGRVR